MLKDIEYIYAVYKERSFSKAARRLFISQPSLSAAVKRVEQELGLPLFNRSTSPVSLTEAGEYYIARCSSAPTCCPTSSGNSARSTAASS